MKDLAAAAEEFLDQRRIAVAGVSRNGDVAANVIYRKLRGAGYEVYAVNPNAETVEGDQSYRDLATVPGGVEGVVVATHPKVATSIVRQCADLGISRVWMHRSFGQGSVDEAAVRLGRELGLRVIPGSCPMMFCQPVDVAHKCLRWLLRVSGRQAVPQGY